MAERGQVAVAGNFDPPHTGHKRLLQGAVFLCQQTKNDLLVILTRDDQVRMKKGKSPFMPFEERQEFLEWMLEGKGVGYKVAENVDSDITSRESLRMYKPVFFVKGGDSWTERNLPELKVCRELGIIVVFGVGGTEKVRSSSDVQESDKIL